MEQRVALIVYYAPQQKTKDDDNLNAMEDFIECLRHKIVDLKSEDYSILMLGDMNIKSSVITGEAN